MTSEKILRVVLVAASPVVRARLRGLLGRAADAQVVAAIGDVAEAHRCIRLTGPDVVLIGAGDASLDVAVTTRALVGRIPTTTKVLLVVNSDVWARHGLWTGIDGVVDEREPAEDVLAAVRMVAAGYVVVPATAAQPAAPVAGRRPHPPDLLTEREVDVLKLLVRGHSNAEISAMLSVSENTVKSHVQRVLNKLELRNRVSAVIYAYEAGLVSVGELSTSDNAAVADRWQQPDHAG